METGDCKDRKGSGFKIYLLVVRVYLTGLCRSYRGIAPIVENQLEKQMDNGLETGGW